MIIFKYFNQNDYKNVPYPSKDLPKATVASGGCGVVSAAMIISNLTDHVTNPKTMALYAIQKGARVSGGTDMITLSKVISIDFGLNYVTTNDENKLLQHLKYGGMAIANVGGNRPGYTGVFSDGGHFVVVAGVTGGKVIVLDPGYYTGKFNKPGRSGKVTVVQGYQCVCDISILAKDTENRSPAYWLFSRREVKPVEDWKIKIMQDAHNAKLFDLNMGHKPDDTAPKWFVLAVMLNMLNIIKKGV